MAVRHPPRSRLPPLLRLLRPGDLPYTHVSDQLSVFATQVISCAPREAGFVLDGLLENDTLLRPQIHTTDTHGFTEQLFGLCPMLGIAFMPRLKDLADQLYKLDKDADHGTLEPLFRGTVDAALISEQWGSADPHRGVAQRPHRTAARRAATADQRVTCRSEGTDDPSPKLNESLLVQ
jgi:Tn3 transposase DDE domain